MIINGKWQRSLQDVCVCRGADIFSDHHQIWAIVKLTLRKFPKPSQKRKHLHISKLKSHPTRNQFVLVLGNWCSSLADSLENKTHDINTQWDSLKAAYVESATKLLGFRQRHQKDWITPQTWQKVAEHLKAKRMSAKSPRLQSQFQKANSDENSEVKRSASRDTLALVDELAREAECASTRGNLSSLYKINQLLSGNNIKPSVPELDKSGRKITTERQEAARWVEHFRGVLNHPNLMNRLQS